MVTLLEVLKQSPVFSGLNNTVLKEIAKECSLHKYKANDLCFSEGEKAENFYLMKSGRITIERRLPAAWLNTEGIIHTIRPGEVFGWSALVEPGVLTATARCVEDSDVIEINGKTLLSILDQDGREGYVFMKRLATVIASRLSETSDRLLKEMAEVETFNSM